MRPSGLALIVSAFAYAMLPAQVGAQIHSATSRLQPHLSACEDARKSGNREEIAKKCKVTNRLVANKWLVIGGIAAILFISIIPPILRRKKQESDKI